MELIILSCIILVIKLISFLGSHINMFLDMNLLFFLSDFKKYGYLNFDFDQNLTLIDEVNFK